MAFPGDYTISDYVSADTDNTKVADTHANMYYLFDLSVLPSAFWDNVRSDCGDLRVTLDDSDSSPTQCAWGLVPGTFNSTTEVGKIFIKIASITSGSDYTLRFYTNGSDTMPSASSTYGSENVWNSDIKGAFTMEDNTTSSILDLTGNSLDGTKSSANNPIESTGYIGKAQDFSSDIIDLGDTTLFDGANRLSLTSVINADTIANDNSLIRKLAAGQQAFQLRFRSTDELDMQINDSTGSNLLDVESTDSNLSTATDYIIKGVWRGTNDIDIYVNGIAKTTNILLDKSPSSIPNVTEHLALGAKYNAGTPTSYFDGKMSLAILSIAEDSDNWATTEYNNIFDTSNFWKNITTHTGSTISPIKFHPTNKRITTGVYRSSFRIIPTNRYGLFETAAVTAINFLVNLTNTSLTTDTDIQIVKDLLVNLTNTSAISNADRQLIKDLLVNLTNTSLLTDTDVQIVRDLLINLANTSLTTNTDIQIARDLLVNLTNTSLTTNSDIQIAVDLLANITNISLTTDIDISLTNLINLLVNLTNTSLTTGIDRQLIKDLLIDLRNISNTADIDIQTIRDILANIINTSLVTNVDIAIGVLTILAGDILSADIIQDVTQSLVDQNINSLITEQNKYIIIANDYNSNIEVE